MVILVDKERLLLRGGGILILVLVLTWFSLNTKFNVTGLLLAKWLAFMGLFGTTIYKILKSILKLKQVNAQVLAGSVSAYLLLGILSAILFEVVELFYPGSFDYSIRYGAGYNLVYYSFVTLSTLGYGDITPHTPQGQAMAILVSITGQLYLAILMAMLVGKFLKDSN